MALQQGGRLIGRQAAGVRQCAGVLGGCFAIRPRRRGVGGRSGRVLEHGRRIHGALGVIGEQRQIVRGDRSGPHHRQHLPVYAKAARDGDGIEHR